MQNWDKNAPVLTFLHPLQSVNMALTKRIVHQLHTSERGDCSATHT